MGHTSWFIFPWIGSYNEFWIVLFLAEVTWVFKVFSNPAYWDFSMRAPIKPSMREMLNEWLRHIHGRPLFSCLGEKQLSLDLGFSHLHCYSNPNCFYSITISKGKRENVLPRRPLTFRGRRGWWYLWPCRFDFSCLQLSIYRNTQQLLYETAITQSYR